MTVLSFWIPTLPGRALSSNGDHRSGFAIGEAKSELGEAAYFACLHDLGPTRPQIERADVYLEFHICHKRRPGDGLYRFTDPSNGGGDVAKPVIDYGIVKTGLIPDDDHRHVRFFTTHIVPVATLAEEGIVVRVSEVTEESEQIAPDTACISSHVL